VVIFFFFFFNDTATTEIYTLSLHDALPISSRDYDPSPGLEKIQAAVMWVNSADDFINPPELGIAEREAKRLKNGRFILLPISDRTHGHGTHTWAAVWQNYLGELLKKSAPK